jgi:SAM-dependent MidA family methyltransferase
VTSKGGNRKLPWAYTEHGIAMMATLLRNDIAIAMSIEIIKAFITLRRIQTNYSSLIARIELLEEFKTESSVILKRLVSHENEVYQSKSGIFFDNEIFDAYVFSSELIAKAKKSIILIDNYIDETTLLQLSKRNKKVHCAIYTERITDQLKLDLEKHNAQYPPIEILILKNTHDRFLILDEKDLYHLGASLKDLGKRWFAFSRLDRFTHEVLSKLNV